MSTPLPVLFVLSSYEPYGWFLPEAAHPHHVLTTASIPVHFASPLGGRAPVYQPSVESFASDPVCAAFLADATTREAVATTRKLSEVNVEEYSAVLYIGGHGPVYDLANDSVSIALAEAFFAAGKPLAGVCHGPAAFKSVKGPDGKSIFAGRRATAFSDAEEEAYGTVAITPFSIEAVIRASGGAFVNTRALWGEEVVVDSTRDGVLITGGNPGSATAIGRAIVDALRTSTTAVTV